MFVFKQKTAYELRISDWSSDVCSSDLRSGLGGDRRGLEIRSRPSALLRGIRAPRQPPAAASIAAFCFSAASCTAPSTAFALSIGAWIASHSCVLASGSGGWSGGGGGGRLPAAQASASHSHPGILVDRTTHQA